MAVHRNPAQEAAAPPPTSLGLGHLLRGRTKFTEDEWQEHEPSIAQGGFDDATWEMIKASPAYLAQEILSGAPEWPYNGKFLLGDHHLVWDRLVMEHERLCVLAPRDHGKTFFFNYAVPIHKAVTLPNCKGYIFSATKEQAIRILDDIKNEIETNPHLQYLVPEKKSRWGSTMIRLTNGHTIYARGFGTRVRGAHPHWIIVDDAINDEHMYSETVRAKAKDYFYSAITNLIVPGGQIIVVGTPFHIEDLYGDLETNTRYHFQRFAARLPSGGPLWPERYSDTGLKDKLEEIQSVRFTREFMCEPISDDMSLFPSYLFVGDPTEQPTLTLGMAKEYWDDLDVTIYMGADFALSSNVGADYTVIWVMGIDPLGNRWIIDIVRGKGLPYQAQLSKILELGKLYDPAMIFLEANQMQAIFGQELIRTTDLPIKPFVTTAHNKNALDKGVPGLRVLLENGKMRIPRGDARSVAMTNEWTKEMRSFTWHEGKLQSVSGHDDMVMAFWICNMAIKAGGFSFEMPEDEEEPQSVDAMLELDNLDEEDHIDIAVVNNRDPEALDDTIRAIHGIAARVVGARTPGGVQLTSDGHLIIRILHGDPRYLRFVLSNQGYADFVREIQASDSQPKPKPHHEARITPDDMQGAIDDATEALITGVDLGVDLIDEDSYIGPLLGRTGVWY